MRKVVFTIALLVVPLIMHAQSVNVHMIGNKVYEHYYEDMDYVEFSKDYVDVHTIDVHTRKEVVYGYPKIGIDYIDFSTSTPHMEPAVDLGLSVYWASCDLGADRPEDIGDFFAWGETSTKTVFTQENYQYYDANTLQYIDIGSDISGTQYDAATVNLGSDWRMPTEAEIRELKDSCTWEWPDQYGCKITGKNGNYIYLHVYKSPFALYRTSDNASVLRIQWVVNPKENPDYITLLTGEPRYGGYPIRPVTSNPKAIRSGYSSNPKDLRDTIDHSNDYHVTDKISVMRTGLLAYTDNHGNCKAGSIFKFTLSNESTEPIELRSVQLIAQDDNHTEGKNILTEFTAIAAGETRNFTLTIDKGSLHMPKARFTYVYNKRKYYVEVNVWEKQSH